MSNCQDSSLGETLCDRQSLTDSGLVNSGSSSPVFPLSSFTSVSSTNQHVQQQSNLDYNIISKPLSTNNNDKLMQCLGQMKKPFGGDGRIVSPTIISL